MASEAPPARRATVLPDDDSVDVESSRSAAAVNVIMCGSAHKEGRGMFGSVT